MPWGPWHLHGPVRPLEKETVVALPPDSELHKGLKHRHLTMIAIGGVIGAGLFVGSGAVINEVGPNGPAAIFSGIVVVIFSMVGAEIATIAAAESADPGRAIAKATNSVVLRIAIFFVGSIFLLAVILPWNSTELGDSPYVSAFEAMGIPGAADIMNAVVLTAVLSCLNSGLYTASRMLFVLAARREAPIKLITVNGRGVPVWAILLSTVVGFLCVIAAYVSPDTVFLFLLNSSGAIILFVYLGTPDPSSCSAWCRSPRWCSCTSSSPGGTGRCPPSPPPPGARPQLRTAC
jgi:GABA permease